MTLPLTKCLDPADFALLPRELAIVDRYFYTEKEQHPARRWEYALAIDAVSRWETGRRQAHTAADVGGAGSPFHRILEEYLGLNVPIVDPELPSYAGDPLTLERYIHHNPALKDVVTCLSVLEHAKDLDRFIYHLNCLVAPGGLLFLTMDCCGHDEHLGQPDQHHFHWMRKRIFTLSHWQYLWLNLRPYGFELLGEADWTYHGDHVYDFTFASLALVKRS